MPRKRKGADLSRNTSKARNLRNNRSERTEEQIQQQNTDARVRMAQLHQEEPEDTRAERNEVRRLEQQQSRRFTVKIRRTNDQQRQQVHRAFISDSFSRLAFQYEPDYNNTNSRIRNFQPNNFSKPSYQGRTNNYTQQNNFNRPPIKCYNCNGNHYAAQCRNKPSSNNNRPSNRNRLTQPPTNYNARASTCAYCKRSGHDISACYKKCNNESRNNNSGNANVSGEDRGTRSINQIIAEEMHNVTTSSLL
ncbi:probable serine/threonine-protein kinase cdc7 [Aphis gossypii]|uniref:probable serine/threonine-protein kinase cdc7 n=1 Tax=Aphis gossypii TaxID=80765 RepID=UPI0021598533|nr:probable serine/threonine-protein kinase cdc7 [Aphis gossypii]